MSSQHTTTRLAAPMVFQCGACHVIVSDSNQLVSAVAELDVLVLDAVVGVRCGPPETDASATLSCAACGHTLGQQYKKPPTAALDGIVHSSSSPRYALTRGALDSYVLGSAAQDNGEVVAPADDTEGRGSVAPTGLAMEAAAMSSAAIARIDALESADADVQLQIAQLMRVVLSLDQRLRTFEELERDGDDNAAGRGRKRPC